MRFFSYHDGSTAGIAVQAGAQAIALASLDATLPTNLTEIVEGGPELLEKIGGLLNNGNGLPVDRDKITYRAPFGTGKIICIGLNYAKHARETNILTGSYPVVFTRFNTTVVAHGDPLLRPRVSDQFDYEVELVAVIGKRAHYVAKEDALSFVAGYTIANDASLRDYQFKTTQFTIGKNFDATCPIGPDFVTADELPAGGKDLAISTRLNGQTVQSQSTSDMIFDVATLVSLLSDTMTLDPGDIILTGTPSGIGMAREPQLFMKHGDTCECEIERIGLLQNPIIDEV